MSQKGKRSYFKRICLSKLTYSNTTLPPEQDNICDDGIAHGRWSFPPFRASPRQCYFWGIVIALLLTVLTSSPVLAEEPYTPPALEWTAPDEQGFEYAQLTVPFDYGDPTGETMNLEATRYLATSPEERIGTLLVAGGGPGGSSIISAQFLALNDTQGLTKRFDIVAVEPRGVRGDSAVKCLSDEERDKRNREAKAFPDYSDRDRILANARSFAEKCMEKYTPEFLASLGTVNVAQDIDVFRSALGEEQISYIGFSYGTVLGATYVARFPDRVRAVVLDGGSNPVTYYDRPLRQLTRQAASKELALERYLVDRCESTPCEFSGGRDGFIELVKKLDANPLNVESAPGRPVTGMDVLRCANFLLNVAVPYSFLDTALADTANGSGDRIRWIADYAMGRSYDGTYGTSPDAFAAITAVDQYFPWNIRFQDDYYDVYRHASPTFGPALYWAPLGQGYSAFEWPVESNAHYYGPFRNPSNNTPILVIGTTFDPATPYKSAVALTRHLRNARLLTVEGDGHLAFNKRTECVDKAVGDYLQDLTVPEKGKTCKKVILE